jgi:two-component system sensor histidine kinase UhpB
MLFAVLPAHLVVQLRSGVPALTALGWFVSNTGEALLGAFCIVRFRSSKPIFRSIDGIIVFLVFGFFLAPLLSSFADAAVVVLTGWGKAYWTMWSRRLFSNMLSVLIVVPPIVILGSAGLTAIRKIKSANWAEACLLMLGIFLVSISIFGGETISPNTVPALVYAPLPFLLWAAVRLGPGGLSGSLLIVAAVSIVEAIKGHGPFTSLSLGENVLYLQILLCVIAVPLMCLAAVLSERQAIEARIRTTNSLLIAAQEEERSRIARELHDDVSQHLALFEVRLAQLKEDSDLSLRPRLERISEQAVELSRVVRELSHGLYPSLLQHLGLSSALRRLAEETCSRKSVSLEVPKNLGEVSSEVCLALFRVAQEALHNIEKHSNAHNVVIQLKAARHRLVLRVLDDGQGFEATQPSVAGIGLSSMKERMEAVGGTVSVISTLRGGTSVEASAPLVAPVLGRIG